MKDEVDALTLYSIYWITENCFLCYGAKESVLFKLCFLCLWCVCMWWHCRTAFSPAKCPACM